MPEKRQLMSASSVGKVCGELRAVPFKAPKTIQEPAPLFYSETYAAIDCISAQFSCPSVCLASPLLAPQHRSVLPEEGSAGRRG